MNVKKTKKNAGFTLVEIIVVLVILAILAAAMIPAMLGYVEESRGKTFADQARVVYNACQTCATEASALGKSNADIATALNAYLADKDTTAVTDATLKSTCAKVNNLIGSDILKANPGMKVVMDDTVAGSVAQVYYDSDGRTTNSGSGYVVWVNVAGGSTNVERDDRLSVITWPAD